MFDSPKKKYFKEKAANVQKMLWDYEFKKFKSLEIREGVRMDYDGIRARMEILSKQIAEQAAMPEGTPGKLTKDEAARLDDQKVIFERDLVRYEAQMKQIDSDVFGVKPSNEAPDGVSGLDDQLDSLQQLKSMIKIYIKTLWEY